MFDADQLVGVAVVPLNFTVLVPFVDPKFDPAIVTDVPTGPLAGVRLVMLGAVLPVTVKALPLLATPPTVTTTLPLVAPDGTGTATLVADQLVGVAVVPLKLTVLVPFVDPKFVPAIVTDVPTDPLIGVSVVIVGAGVLVVPAALNAAIAAPHRSTTDIVAVAVALPAVACTASSTTSLAA